MDEVFTAQEIESKDALPIKFNKGYNVIQANELVRSKQDELTLLEAKLIRLAIAQILKEDNDFITYSCNVSKLAEFLGISRQTVYEEIQDISITLLRKVIHIREKKPKKNGKPNFRAFHWVESVVYKDGIITFRLSQELKPYLIGLNELFTSFRYEEIIKLPTNKSIRLYELLVSFANIQFREQGDRFTYKNIPLEKDEIIFTIDELRTIFNCEDKYPNTADFIKYVISSGIKDINKYTVFPCSYRTIKEGRKIAYVVFKLGNWKSIEGQVILEEFRERARKK